MDFDFSTGTMQKILKIDVKGIPWNVRMGENAKIKLVPDKADNALVIPKRALRKYPRRTNAQILENGIKPERDVVTDVESKINIEIVEGLEEGDLVIIN